MSSSPPKWGTSRNSWQSPRLRGDVCSPWCHSQRVDSSLHWRLFTPIDFQGYRDDVLHGTVLLTPPQQLQSCHHHQQQQHYEATANYKSHEQRNVVTKPTGRDIHTSRVLNVGSSHARTPVYSSWLTRNSLLKTVLNSDSVTGTVFTRNAS